MLVTALNPHIGYEKQHKLPKAHKEGLTLKNLQLLLVMLQKLNLKTWIKPESMVDPH